MLQLTKYIICVTFLAFVLSCTPEPVPEEPNPLNDGKPRLVSLSFPGIPKEEIIIDQKNYIVKVKVPSTISKDMMPTISLTDNAALHGGMEFIFDTYHQGVGLLMGDSVMLRLVYKNDPEFSVPVATYFFIPIPNGPLQIAGQTNPVEHTLYNDDFGFSWLSCENLYGNKLPKSFQLVNKETKEKINQVGRMVKGRGNQVNQLGLELDAIQDLIPGSYDLTLFGSSGESLTFQQSINVKMGPALLEYPAIYFGINGVAGKILELNGINLFEKHIAIEVLDSLGKSSKLTDLEFARNGHSLTVKLPYLLPPGQYILKVFQDGKAIAPCYRLNIFKDEKPVSYIGTIGDDEMPCSLSTPVNVTKETNFF